MNKTEKFDTQKKRKNIQNKNKNKKKKPIVLTMHRTHFPWRQLSGNQSTTILDTPLLHKRSQKVTRVMRPNTWSTRRSREGGGVESTLSYRPYLNSTYKLGSSSPRPMYQRGLLSGTILVLRDRIKFYRGKGEGDDLRPPLKKGIISDTLDHHEDLHFGCFHTPGEILSQGDLKIESLNKCEQTLDRGR